MDGTFVTALVDRAATPQAINGMTLAPGSWQQVTPAKPPAPSPLQLTTLTGIRDYLSANVDKLNHSEVMLCVAADSVGLVSCLEGAEEQFRRQVLLQARAVPSGFRFGEYLDAEAFHIGARTSFVVTPELLELLELLASIRENSVRETLDDGLSQEVNTSRGVVVSNRTKVPPTVMLQPYRTFREVDQPLSAFLVRLRSEPGKDKPSIALFEADGGQWRVDAISRIAGWLRENTEEVAVIG